MQLAHSIKDKAEAAYRHGDLLEQRRPLVEAWAGCCAKAEGSVVPMVSKIRHQR